MFVGLDRKKLKLRYQVYFHIFKVNFLYAADFLTSLVRLYFLKVSRTNVIQTEKTKKSISYGLKLNRSLWHL